jgi:hypothetical protein
MLGSEEESQRLLARMEWAILEETFRAFCEDVQDKDKEKALELFNSLKKRKGPGE